LTMTAGRPLWAREAVSSFPAPQRVGADAKHHGRRIRSDPAHIQGFIEVAARPRNQRNDVCTVGVSVQRRDPAPGSDEPGRLRRVKA
jgi:hypothetical protein